MSDLTPREIVSELDRFIIGQNEAKRAVAIALRNRWRRLRLVSPMREEVYPKNILMIGPTGVGKTEIARRLARLADAPFLKVEATKFTEVGYVGRDVEAIIRDLVDLAVKGRTDHAKRHIGPAAEARAEERLLDILLPGRNEPHTPLASLLSGEKPTPQSEGEESATRKKFRKLLRDGALDDREVEIEVKETRGANFEVFTPPGMDGGNIQEMLGGLFGNRTRTRRVKVREALGILAEEEAGKLVDREQSQKEAVERVEQAGIVFIDEIDKVCSRGSEYRGGAEVSREGVQRDLLPLVEGTTVSTKYGMVRTDHILFIASGAFHLAKPSDLLPELQGRFPIRVELKSLGVEEFVRILSEPVNSLTRQYESLLATEEIRLHFQPDGVRALAEMAARVNESSENIGARRLHTILERLLDDVSFTAPDHPGQVVVVDNAYVQRQLAGLVADQDLSRYIL